MSERCHQLANRTRGIRNSDFDCSDSLGRNVTVVPTPRCLVESA